jgi:hypothetical protein
MRAPTRIRMHTPTYCFTYMLYRCFLAYTRVYQIEGLCNRPPHRRLSLKPCIHSVQRLVQRYGEACTFVSCVCVCAFDGVAERVVELRFYI